MQNPVRKKTTRTMAIRPSQANSMKHATAALLRNEQGSVLLIIIIVLIIFSALGAAMLPLTTTANRSMVHTNLYQTAYYLAESGYRYAASQFLHAGDGLTAKASADARDTMITTLDGAPPFQVDTNSSFELLISAYYFDSISVNGSNLVTSIYGSPPPITSQAGYLLIGDTNYKYHYNSITVTDNTAQFNTIQDWTIPASPVALASTPGNERVFPVCQSNGSILTNASVSCTAGTGIGIFPPKNGSFKINNTGHVYSYKNLDSANNQLQGISSPSGGPLPVTLTTNDFLVMQRCITLTSTGSIGGDVDPATHSITYYLANISTGTSGGGGNTTPPVSDLLPPDNFDNMDNWLPNGDDLVHGEGAIDASKPVPGGGTALMITNMSGSDHFVMPASSVISNALKDLWSWENGLSYDAQVKIVVDSNISYAGGLYFRRHKASGSTNTSFGVSMVYLKDYNDRSVDVYADTLLNSTSADNHNDNNSCYDKKNSTYCLLATQTPYLVLWKDTGSGPSSFKTIAYYQLPANYPADSPYWPTLLVRILEKPSAPGYCGTLAGSRVNEIQIYYSTNSTGTGNTTPTDTTRVGNLRGTVKWPPDTGGTSASNDYFTLVDWNVSHTGPSWSSASYQFGNPGDGTNTVICTTNHLTNISAYGDSNGPATDFPPEVALAAMGNNVQQHTWFDDFAIGSGTNNGSGIGSLTPGFQVPIQE